ncbi:uncharacterized protein [Littorina saxatilis]|uniref:Ig-like domain-containing protein n=1 Tax=Littorina saxatilis TaxID=31220 RepID=A0AAN9BJ50_9CAEN
MKNASIVSFILSTATLAFCEGLAIIGCNSDGSMSVEDHVKDLLLVSGDLDMTSFTIWTFQDRNTSNPRQIISNCSTHSPSSSSPVWFCDSTFNVMIKTDINEHTRRSHVILPDMSVGRFPDGTWRCENGGRVAECSIDVVYTPTDVQCQVTIDEDRSMVEGTCHISRMFSSHGKYSCQWFEKNGNQEEVALPSSQTQFTRSDCSEGGFVYYCGNCSFSKGLPAVSERYGYRVSILPGNISPSVEFTVKPKADAPSSPQTQLPPTSSVAVVDEDAVNAALKKGIGIGVGSLLAAFLLSAAVTFSVWKWRNKDKEETDDGHHTSVDINHYSEANSNSSPPPFSVPHTQSSRPRDTARTDDDSTDRYLTPVDINHISQATSNSSPPPLPAPHSRPSRPRDNAHVHEDDSETVPKQPAGYEGSRGGNRALSALPASDDSETVPKQPAGYEGSRGGNRALSALPASDDSETLPKQPAGNEGSRGGNRALSALPASGQRENDDSNHLSIDNKSLPSEYGSGSSLSAVSQAVPSHPTQQS